jgi:hypothetical protein
MGLDTSVPWKALVYEYDMSRTEGGRLVRNELVFDAGTEPPLLDHYNIPQSYSNEQVPEYAAVPAEVALGLPGLPDAVSAACADALELVGADACYRTMDELQYWRYARTMSQAGQWASRNVAFITGAAQDEWHTAARKSLMGCYAALAGHVYGQPPDDEFVDMAARPIPDWVRGQCQGRWWTPTPDAAIVERIASYEVIRNEGGGQAAGAAAMQQRCAKLRPPEGQRESAQVAAWAGCTNCDAAILDYVFGVWPAKGETLAQMVQQSCHDATVSIADSDAQTLVNAIIAEVESGKAQGVDRTAAAARGASEQAALRARLAELDALPPDDAGMDPRQARLRRRARLLECGSAVIDYVYR